MGAGWGANGLMRNGLGPGGMPNGLGGLGGGLAGLGINEYGLANGLVGDNQALLSSMGLSNLAAGGCEQLPTETGDFCGPSNLAAGGWRVPAAAGVRPAVQLLISSVLLAS